MFLCARALTAVQEMRLEVKRKRMTFYQDAGCFGLFALHIRFFVKRDPLSDDNTQV